MITQWCTLLEQYKNIDKPQIICSIITILLEREREQEQEREREQEREWEQEREREVLK